MVTHIVLWKLIKDEAHDPKEGGARIKQELEALVGVIPGLISAQVGTAMGKSDYDLCLLSTFESAEALTAYRTNPDHVKVADYVHTVACARTAFDFESDTAEDVDPFVF